MFEPTDSRAVRVLIPPVVFLVLGNLQLSAANYTKCQGRAESRTADGCEAGGHVTIFRHLHSWQNIYVFGAKACWMFWHNGSHSC